ncbi:MAG TPA: chromosomal replication initiator protein DnaA [Ignavibacteriaceae bacterium]
MDNLKFINLETSTSAVNTDANLIWKNCLTRIKENVTLMTYNTWFLPIRPVSFSDNNLKVQLPNQFFWEWIDEHFSTIVKKTIFEVLGENGKLSYIISDEQEQKEEFVKQSSLINTNVEKTIETKRPEHETNLNPRYKFENFIKGEGNQLARAAAGAISDNPGGTSFNPFFIYGGVGLGKTHLIQSIGNSIIEKFPEKKVIYLSSDSFTVEFVEAIQSNKVNDFSGFYRNMDVLIIDDIQFLMGKEKTQDLFFHIFNTLHQSRKQIILSSDKPPKDLKGLDERLISRFQWGLSADIQPPELEMRIAILKNKAEEYGMLVSTEILEFIAGSITSNIRELEGCLIKLLANASLNSKEITLELAKRTVKEIATDRKINITIDDISKVVCHYLNIPENKIREKTRKKEIVLARQLAMYFSKELTKSSLKTIGLHFGGRDHSTVIHACGSIEQMRNNDLSMKELIDSIRNKIDLNYS